MRYGRPPYFVAIEEALRDGRFEALENLDRHIHFGYWDAAGLSDMTATSIRRAAERLCLEIAALGDLRDGQRVLDVGCGFGATLATLDRHYDQMELVGLNIDPAQIARARQEVRPTAENRIVFHEGDACDLPFPDASFDAVLAVECIFHFPSRSSFFQEARRVLRPQGRLVLSDFVPAPGLAFWFKLSRIFSPCVAPLYSKVDISKTLRGYRALAQASGLLPFHEKDISVNVGPSYLLWRAVLRELYEGPMETLSTELIYRLGALAGEYGLLRYMILAFAVDGGLTGDSRIPPNNRTHP